jgi:hypothetical protein
MCVSLALLAGCAGSERARYQRHLEAVVDPVLRSDEAPVAAGAFGTAPATDAGASEE